MRFFMKGGVWKNTEDEILKAAVMKYGKNQWARIASLMPRKSAKQCKARWYEWLDPSIKKTEWTREEEEKLLHLAKLLPTQWRTIAPLVGRTAAQCMEHYEKLLDAAQEKDDDYDASDDPRRLRPGEIDPAPETKPARPDPVDMDEDEKEMLSEARARLANTKGKKAKRKAREKQLNEAKRLAALQKKRELRAAGISSVGTGTQSRKKRKYIDYGKEIPFEKTVPVGYYDVTAEDELVRKDENTTEFVGKRLADLEGKWRDDDERKERQEDRKRQKKMAQSNLPMTIVQVNNKNDPSAAVARTQLALPAPQVSDQELEDIVKVGYQNAEASELARGGGASGVTNDLLADYSAALATPTPMRTPRTEMAQDVVLQEAQNLIKLTNMETPLLGGDNPDLARGTGFEGATPRESRIQTPSHLALAATPARDSSGMTPMMARSGMTPSRTGTDRTNSGHDGSGTPMRDSLGINQDVGDDFSSTSSNYGGGGNKKPKKQGSDLRRQLEDLPEPQYSYEINVPEMPQDVGDDGAQFVADAAELEEKRIAALKAEEQRALARRSSAVQKELPLPSIVSPNLAPAPGDDSVEGLIAAELYALLQHDHVNIVNKSEKGKKKKKKSKSKGGDLSKLVNLETFEDGEIAKARKLVEKELQNGGGISEHAPEELDELWSNAFEQYIVSNGQTITKEGASNAELIGWARTKFESVRAQMGKDAKKAKKIEEKLTILTKGYVDRNGTLRSQTTEACTALSNSTIQLTCFRLLQSLEESALPMRLQTAEREHREVVGRESGLQKMYANLQDQCRVVSKLLRERGVSNE